MSDIVSSLSSYAASYIGALESILVSFWYLPIIDNIYLGPLILFFILCGFVFHWFTEWIGGSDND